VSKQTPFCGARAAAFCAQVYVNMPFEKFWRRKPTFPELRSFRAWVVVGVYWFWRVNTFTFACLPAIFYES
jgi:hypothetical protein